MSRGTVLVVSDEQATQDLLSDTLASYNVSVLVAEDAAQAINALNTHRLAVVILDWPLAENQDETLLRTRDEGLSVVLHTRQTLPETLVIGVLDEGDSSASPDLVALGMNDYLVKPLLPDLVRLTVDRTLERQRLKREAERLALINQVGRQLASILDMNQLLWQVARLIRESFDFYYVAIALLEGDMVEVKAAVGGERDQLPPISVRYNLKDSQEMMARALACQEPLLIADLQGLSSQALLPELAQARSALVMPIALQDQQLGVLEVLSAEPRAFELDDLPLFESLAAQIAVAVQNAHLFAERQKHEETLRLLNAAALAMQRVITSQPKVLEVMASELARSDLISLLHLRDSSSASVNLLHSSLSPRLTRALTELLDTEPRNWPLDLARAPIYQQAWDERRAIFVEHIEPLITQIVPVALPSDKIDLIIHILGHPCAVVAPMLVGDQAIGWLTVFSALITAEDGPAIMAFANQAAVALENARLLAGARRADELVLINQAGQAMTATLEFDKVLRLLLQAVAKTLQVDECVLALWNEGAQRHVARAGLVGGKVMFADPFAGDALMLDSALPPLHVPLVGLKRELGLLTLDRHSDGTPLNAEDLQLARALANQAASALENARLYDQLRRSAEELEQSHRRLIQSEKLAATGRLAASIAHEINNPLQAIKNCLELIRDEAEADEPLDLAYLDVATDELERIRGIIQQMLDLYRPRQERMAPVDLNAAVEGVLALVRKHLESHQVTVEAHLGDSIPRVMGRGDQIRQVFINLILNAIEAMPQGGHITVTTQPGADGMVAIRVADTGIGIAPEDLMRIYDPFFTTKSKGLGLGLAICYEIIERHQGTLDATSQVGQGSTFTIRLPAIE